MPVLARLLVLLSCALPACVLGADALAPVSPRVAAPDFVLGDTDGRTHRLSDYRGRVVIVNFWATWCPPCREEIPSMNRAWRQLEEEGIALLAINVGEDEDTIFIFTADYPADFPLLMDRDGKVIEAWPVKGLPTTYVVAPDGTIAYRAIGSREWDEEALLAKIRELQE